MDVLFLVLEKGYCVIKMIGNGMCLNIWDKFKQWFGIEEILEFYVLSEGNVGFSNVFNFDNIVGFLFMFYVIIQFDKEKNVFVYDVKGGCIKVKKGEVGLLIGKIICCFLFDGYIDFEKNKLVIFKDVFKFGDVYFNIGDLVCDIGFCYV